MLIKYMNMKVKHITTEEPHNNDCYTMLGAVASFVKWEKKQRRVVRGCQVMFDIKDAHKYMYANELWEYWIKNVYKGNCP